MPSLSSQNLVSEEVGVIFLVLFDEPGLGHCRDKVLDCVGSEGRRHKVRVAEHCIGLLELGQDEILALCCAMKRKSRRINEWYGAYQGA